jgi:transcriptional regulator with XRE-family HTH domain
MLTTGNVLKKMRSDLGLTQKEFAAKIKITKELLGQMERGVRELSYSTSLELGRFLKENKVPDFLVIQYMVGQNLEKVLDELFLRGLALTQFKSFGINIRKSHLASMYIGVIPVPLEFKNLLVKHFNVRLKFINDGILPMFSDDSKLLSQVDDKKKASTSFLVELQITGQSQLKRGQTFAEALFLELQQIRKTSPSHPGFSLLASKLEKLEKEKLHLEAMNAFFEMNVSIDCSLAERLKTSDIVSRDCFVSFNEIGKVMIDLIYLAELSFVLSRRYWISPYSLRLEFEVCPIGAENKVHITN